MFSNKKNKKCCEKLTQISHLLNVEIQAYPSSSHNAIPNSAEQGIWSPATYGMVPTEPFYKHNQISLGLHEEMEDLETAKICRRTVASSANCLEQPACQVKNITQQKSKNCGQRVVMQNINLNKVFSIYCTTVI